MIHLTTSTAFLAIQEYLQYCLCRYSVPQFWELSTKFLSFTLSLCCLLWHCLCLYLLIKSNSFALLVLSNTAFCSLCSSTIWAQIKTCLLLTSITSFKAVSSLIIMAILVSLFRPYMNCPFSPLSYSWCLQSVTLIYCLHIDSLVDSWLIPSSSPYHKDNLVSLWWSLNFLPSVKIVLLLFCMAFFTICKCLY